MEAYAVLETGGKQLLVKVGDKIAIEKLDSRRVIVRYESAGYARRFHRIKPPHF